MVRFARCLAMFLFAAYQVTADDTGRIYVYAERDSEAHSWMGISCGGAVVAEIERGTFFAVHLASGRYSLSTERGIPTAVEIRSGEDVFIRLGWNYGIDRPPIAILRQAPADQAERAMKYLSYVPLRHIFSSAVDKADPRTPVKLQLKTRQ